MGTAASGNAGVGTIKVVTGDVKIIGVDGVARQAQVGDKVFAKETIQTNANAIVQVQLENGRMLDLGRDSKIALDDDVLNVGQGPSTAPAAAATTDIAALQAQIAAGADPSKVAEATAAGGAPGAGGTADGSGGTAVYVDQANSSGEVTSGYNTGIGGIGFPTLDPGVLPVIDNVPVVSVSVSVQVQVQVDVGVGSGTGGSGGDGGGAVQPIDFPGDTDGDGVVVSGNVANLIEGTGPGARVVNFIISLDKVFDVDVTVTYQIVPGTAQVGSDITLTNGLTGTVVIPAGQISFIVPVNIVQDSNVESNETFSIVLTGATNATINPDASTAQAVIFDDDIQARPDTNWAKEDGVAATGNVLTGGSHSPDARGDDPSSSTTFADQGDLNTALATMSVVNTGTFAGNYGTLVLNANGSYTYALYTQAQNPEAYAAVQALDDGESLPPESFSYTARNSLGGASVSTLQITVFGSNDAPTIDAQTNVRVSEEGLEGRFGFGNPDNDGNQDTTNTTFVSGTITVGDVDVEPLTVVLHAPTTALASHGQTIVWSGEGTGMLTGSIPNGEGSIQVITITITNTGAYTVTLLGPIDHAGANVEDDKSFNVGVTVSDGTASTNGNMTVTVEDDSPIITTYRQGYVPQLIVDESTLANDATASFAGAFGFVQFGSDGAAAANSQVYTLGITANTDSGLIDSLTQQHVILSVTAGGVVEGRTTGGDLVFTVSVNAGTGEVTLDQLRAVMHDTATNPDTSEGVTLSGLVTLTLNVKDFDLDTASQTVNIGNALQFNDDGPSISVATTLGECEQIIPVPEPTLTVDETDLSTNATADFSGNFTSAYGADGPGAITYALGVSEQGVDSGLIDVATGEPIFLYVNEAGVVEGRVGSDGEANPEGAVDFTVSVDANGVVTLDQIHPLQHPNAQNPDDPVSMADNLITLTATITDRDGDSATATLNIGGNMSFEDDGPTLTVTGDPTFSALSVVEASGAGGSQTVQITAPTYTASAVDGYTDSVSYALSTVEGAATGLQTTNGNYAITLHQVDANTIQGVYNGSNVAFTITLSGSSVTLTSSVALEHANGPQNTESDTLNLGTLVNVVATVTVTDGDNDQIVNSVDAVSPLSLTISDTDPTLTVTGDPTFSALSVVEASGAGGSQTVQITAPTYTASAVDGYTDSVSYALSTVEGAATGLQTTNGNYAITLHQVDANTIQGVYNGSNVAFTITLSGSSVTLTSLVALEHSNTQGAGEINTLNLGTLVNVVATVTVTDGDGDVISTSAGASAPLSLTISDTDPKLVVPETIFVEDKGVVGTTDQVVANLNFTSGADGVGSVKFNAADISANLTGDALVAGATTSTVAAKDAAGNNLLVGGQQLYLYLSADGTTLTASTGTTAGGTVGFTLSLNGGAGTYTFNPEAVITNGTEVSSSTIQTVGGGNKDWKAFINLGGTTQDAFLTTKSGDSVNTNNGEIGITDGNSFKVGEGLRIDLLNGLTTSGSGGGETFSVAGSYNLTNSFRQIVTFTNQGNANITLAAIIADAPSNVIGDYYGDVNDVKVDLSLSDIKIYDASHNLVTGLVMTDNLDGSITINGIQADWTFEINSATQFNAVQIDAASGSGQFKLGVFSYGNEFVGTQIDLNYNVIATDGDNDAVAGQLGITLTRDAITTTGDNLTGTVGDDVLIGTSANSTLSGGDGNDVLAGNSGNDSLTGGNGNDILIGGAGSDNMTGSAGSDTFKWNNGDQGSGAAPTDTVTDFNTAAVASGGDVLNLKDLLVLENHTVGNGNLGSFLSFAQTGADVTLTVHSQGAAGPVDQTIVLQNTSMTALAGANTADSAGVIANLLSQGKLITD